MIAPVDLTIDVTDTASIGMPAHTVATVHLPEPDQLCDPPVVCFAFPGGGYSRQYYTFDMPGDVRTGDDRAGGQAGWHTRRGWIFVACDHLGFGDATAPGGNVLNYDNVALGNKATVEAVMTKLEAATLVEGYPSVTDAVRLGIGQSMGGCFTIVLQGQHRVFDGIASLGFSAIHTVVPSRPGSPAAVWPWVLRGSDLAAPVIVNPDAIAAATAPSVGEGDKILDATTHREHPFTWAFHWDDEPADVVAMDMAASVEGFDGALPAWRSVSTPSCGLYMVAPGTVATEAAGITVPVLLATGERDVVPNPWMEPFAFKSARDITVYICPKMAHMHNFAGTRHQLWDRIHTWGNGVAHVRSSARCPQAVPQVAINDR